MSCLARCVILRYRSVLTTARLTPAAATGGDHLVALGDGGGHRLLGEDVLARRGG